ncbi:MAG: Hsp20/alpha crystallin family protein [Thermoplasmatales archaeon]|nr:Hsp20/alpha crystallin family protein [Thermoplasmatales archaeon]
MVRKKDKEKDSFDWFDDWGFDDIFEEFDERFRKMQHRINKLLKDAMEGNIPAKEGGPFIYGWSFRVGPDGKPQFEEFGNIKPRTGIEEMAREPLVDVIEEGDKICVTAEVPGVTKEDINLEITDSKLVIKVDREDRKYYKEVKLPAKVDEDSAKATYQNGVLDIEFKKIKAEKKGKRIEIK